MSSSADPLESAEALVVGPFFLDSFAYNVAAGLRSHGIRTVGVDPSAGIPFTSRIDSHPRYGAVVRELVRRSNRVRRAVVDRPVDRAMARAAPRLVICLDANLTPEQVERWRRMTPSAAWAFWYPDALANLGSHRLMLAPYDAFFFKEPHLVELLQRRTTVPAHLLPEACNPDHHRSTLPRDEAERRRYACDVALAGNMYPYRLLVLDAIPQDVDLRLYGNPRSRFPKGFERLAAAWTGEYVAGRTKALAFGGAKIVLGTMHYAEIRGVNARIFETTGSGGFLLTHAAPEIGRYFIPGQEIAVFDSRSDLADALHHYLHAEEERRAIAAAGQARAHRDHTYHRRIAELIRLLHLEDQLHLTAPV